jgi:hypothetical protein
MRTTPRADVILHGRRGLYTTTDGFTVERDEGCPAMQVWLVGLPKNVAGDDRQPVQAVRLRGAADLIADARLALDNPLALDQLGFTVWPHLADAR